MGKQQEVGAHPNEIRLVSARMREDMRGMAHSGRQTLPDLTRLRIERNRAARHARCAIAHK